MLIQGYSSPTTVNRGSGCRSLVVRVARGGSRRSHEGDEAYFFFCGVSSDLIHVLAGVHLREESLSLYDPSELRRFVSGLAVSLLLRLFLRLRNSELPTDRADGMDKFAVGRPTPPSVSLVSAMSATYRRNRVRGVDSEQTWSTPRFLQPSSTEEIMTPPLTRFAGIVS